MKTKLKKLFSLDPFDSIPLGISRKLDNAILWWHNLDSNVKMVLYHESDLVIMESLPDCASLYLRKEGVLSKMYNFVTISEALAILYSRYREEEG